MSVPRPRLSARTSSSRSTTSSSSAKPFTRRTPSSWRRYLSARAGLIQITVTGLLWGTAGVSVQLLRQATTLSPISIGFYRLAIATLVLLGLRSPRTLVTALRSAPLALLLTGLGLGTYQALYFVAVTLGGVSVATVISLGLAPVVTAGWETVIARRRPGRITLTTLTAGLAGLILITTSTTRASSTAPRPLLGLLAAISCGLVYAATTILSRHLAQRIEPMTLTTLSTGIGALALAPPAVIAGIGFPLGASTLGLLAYLGIVTTALAYVLFYAGLRTTSGSTAAVLTLLEPLTAALLAVLLLGEALPLPALAGGLLLLAAIAVLYLSAG
jgi:drug/metabolite transporter (DMT)-like permease